jgi:hypothetical protein
VALKIKEKTNNKKTKDPSANKNCSVVFMPRISENTNVLFKKVLVSIISGLVKTAIKGIIDATPTASNIATIRIINNRYKACFLS